MLFIAITASFLLFFVAWAWCVKINNFSPVDAFWALGIGLISFYFLFGDLSVTTMELVAGGMIGMWSLRLGLHLGKRIAQHHPTEDSRYVKLREIWVGRVNSSFFWFFQAQALSVFILALPFYIIAQDSSPDWHILHSVGAVVAFGAWIGESIADRQMARFKASVKDPCAVCSQGLWKYSRHPNYFFESVIWLGIFLFTAASPYGWISIYAPIMITYLLLKVTGIPATEASALKRKGEAYRQYQLTTSAFFPLPPKTPNKPS